MKESKAKKEIVMKEGRKMKEGKSKKGKKKKKILRGLIKERKNKLQEFEERN